MAPFTPRNILSMLRPGTGGPSGQRPPGSGGYGYQSFMKDLSDLTRRRAEDRSRTSLFEKVSPGNVGNVFNVEPSQFQFANTNTQDAYGRPVRVLEVVGEDVLGEMLCVSLQQETIFDTTQFSGGVIPGLNDVVEGPLVGIVEFGAGAGISSFEFDINPPTSFPGFIAQDTTGVIGFRLADLSVSRRVSGAMLSLPASSMRVFVRNDANAPYLMNVGGNTTAGLPPVPRSLNALNKAPGIVRVHATYGRRTSQAFLTRSYPICNAQTTDGAGSTASFTAGDRIIMYIPTYARRVYFPRSPLNTTTLSIEFDHPQLTAQAAGQMFTGPHIIPAGSIGPIELYPLAATMTMTVPAAATAIDNLVVVFELAI